MRISKISRKSVFYSLFAISVSNCVLQLLGFLYRIFLSRMAGAEGLGVYQLLMPFYSVVSSLTLNGLTVAVARIAASKAGVGDMCGATRTVTLSRRIFSVSVIILTAICLSGSGFISRFILGDVRTAMSLPLVFACLFLTGLENILKNYFYGVGKVYPQIISELSEQVIRALAVAALLIAFRSRNPGVSAMLIFLGMVISELFSSSLLSVFYRPETRKLSSRHSKPVKTSDILAISVPVSAAATINNLLGSVNSILIPRRLQSSGLSLRTATESFGAMFGMTMPLLMFPIAFIASLTSVMVPKISEQLAAGDAHELRRKAGKTIHATGLLAMPCFAVLIPLGEPLCRVLFSHEAAGSFIFPLGIGTLLSYYEMTTGALLNGIGMQKKAAVYIVISGLLQLGFTWSVGFSHIGMQGYVAGYVFSSGLCALLNFLCLKKKLCLSPRWGNWFFTPLLASVFSGLMCNIAYNLLLSRALPLYLCLILAAAAALVSYAISLGAMGTNIIKYIKTLIPHGA